jgi:hypothetical protein
MTAFQLSSPARHQGHHLREMNRLIAGNIGQRFGPSRKTFLRPPVQKLGSFLFKKRMVNQQRHRVGEHSMAPGYRRAGSQGKSFGVECATISD